MGDNNPQFSHPHFQSTGFPGGPGRQLPMDYSRQTGWPQMDAPNLSHVYYSQDPMYHASVSGRSSSRWPKSSPSPLDLPPPQHPHHHRFPYPHPNAPQRIFPVTSAEEMRIEEASGALRRPVVARGLEETLLMESYGFPGLQRIYETPHPDASISAPPCEPDDSYVMVNEGSEKGRGSGKSKLRAEAADFFPNAQGHVLNKEDSKESLKKKPKEFTWLVVG
ncbi:hypothetical protein BDV59DRAFT_201534 [Aspergillus ambiguus]|uniref:uncharacterized protein n=1 Tax=Aspergillus ambiguus TaxID=176160 RepID=UPI003CCDB7A4